jgi:hypothetical protein
MPVSTKTRKMLWGRGAGRCAICKERVFESEAETDDPSVLGEECHIVARELDGPRGEDLLPVGQRDLYANLILLCHSHHKIIDDQPAKYSVQDLHRIKSEHVEWVDGHFPHQDKIKQRDDETWGDIIDRWADLVDLDTWEGFTYTMMYGDHPSMHRDRFQRFEQLRAYLFSRIFPERYPDLQSSLMTFRLVLADLLEAFQQHADEHGNCMTTSKFYKIKDWNPELYERLQREYGSHVDLVEDLTLELTRAANLVCDRVRENLSPRFRVNEGVVVARRGIAMDLKEKLWRPRYSAVERAGQPYPGLEEFRRSTRYSRDIYFGDRYEAGEI